MSGLEGLHVEEGAAAHELYANDLSFKRVYALEGSNDWGSIPEDGECKTGYVRVDDWIEHIKAKAKSH